MVWGDGIFTGLARRRMGAAAAGCAVFGALLVGGVSVSAAAAVSLAAGVLAVGLPQAALQGAFRRCRPEKARTLWSGKFLLTLLLAALAARGLRDVGWLAAEWFVVGVAAGAVFNIASLAAAARRAG